MGKRYSLVIGLLAFSFFNVAAVLTTNCSSATVTEHDLFHYLFANYTKQVRPKRDPSRPVEVALSLRVTAVNDLIERQNTLILDGFIQLSWQDDFLVWNSVFPYSCLPQVVVPPNYTWIPDVSLINSPDGLYSVLLAPGISVWIASDGNVLITPGGQIATKCEIDVTYFPLDKQTCSLEFESWNYETTFITYVLDPKHPFVRVDHAWTENNQWLIESNHSFITNVTYFSGNYHYAHATFTLILHRKALFYYVNIIVPSIIISVVELATFVLPIEEVIKIHISFTCLLAYSVFQGMVIADLPRSGESVPLLSLYIDLQMAYIGIIALMGEAVVFLVIRKAEQKKNPPSAITFSVFSTIARFLGVGFVDDIEVADIARPETKNERPLSAAFMPQVMVSMLATGTDRRSTMAMQERLAKAAQQASTSNKADKPETIRVQWLFVAEVIERFNMIIYILAIVITPTVMFNLIPKDNFASSPK